VLLPQPRNQLRHGPPPGLPDNVTDKKQAHVSVLCPNCPGWETGDSHAKGPDVAALSRAGAGEGNPPALKSEGRRPKSEGNPKSEIRRPRSQTVRAWALHPILRPQALPCHATTAPNEGSDADFGFRISDFGFPSDFGASDFGLRPSDFRAARLALPLRPEFRAALGTGLDTQAESGIAFAS